MRGRLESLIIALRFKSCDLLLLAWQCRAVVGSIRNTDPISSERSLSRSIPADIIQRLFVH